MSLSGKGGLPVVWASVSTATPPPAPALAQGPCLIAVLQKTDKPESSGASVWVGEAALLSPSALCVLGH